MCTLLGQTVRVLCFLLFTPLVYYASGTLALGVRRGSVAYSKIHRWVWCW